MRLMKILILISLTAGLSACWNGENVHVSLGDVSVGQQLLDLKAALDAGAMSQQEYDETRLKFLSLVQACQDDEDSEDE